MTPFGEPPSSPVEVLFVLWSNKGLRAINVSPDDVHPRCGGGNDDYSLRLACATGPELIIGVAQTGSAVDLCRNTARDDLILWYSTREIPSLLTYRLQDVLG